MNINQLVWVCPETKCSKIHPFLSEGQIPPRCQEEKVFTHDADGNEYPEPQKETWHHDPPILCILIRLDETTKPQLAREWMQSVEPLKIQDQRR